MASVVVLACFGSTVGATFASASDSPFNPSVDTGASQTTSDPTGDIARQLGGSPGTGSTPAGNIDPAAASAINTTLADAGGTGTVGCMPWLAKFFPDACKTTTVDPTGGLGGTAPMCSDPNIDVLARQSCRLSGSIAHPYPTTNYGLDNNVDWGLTNLGNLIPAVLQWIACTSWIAFVYVFDGVLSILEWAFRLNLMAESMQRVREGLRSFQMRVLGDGWAISALAATSLWGLWYGLVRRRTVETIGGLAATIGLMIVALLIISRPDDTVGLFSNMTNQASLQVLSGISQASIDNPGEQSFVNADRAIFDAVILRPWCALEFGNVEFCLNQRKDGDTGETIADAEKRHDEAYAKCLREQLRTDDRIRCKRAADEDLNRAKSAPSPSRQRKPDEPSIADAWLQFRPNGIERLSFYDIAAGIDDGKGTDTKPCSGLKVVVHTPEIDQMCATTKKVANELIWKDPTKVMLQGPDGVVSRMALEALIVIGLIGAILLFGYLALKLLWAALFALMLTLMAPVMLLVAALGNSGRRTFVAYLQRLAAQIFAKLVYAFFLAVVVLQATVLGSLDLGFYPTWLVQIVFWWGVLVKRHDLIGFLSLDQAPAEGGLGMAGQSVRGGGGMMGLYYGLRMAGQAREALMAGPRAVVDRVRRSHLERAGAESEAIAEMAAEEQAGRAAFAKRNKDAADREKAERIVKPQDEAAARANAEKADLRRRKQRDVASKEWLGKRKARFAADKRRHERRKALVEKKIGREKPKLGAERAALQGQLDATTGELARLNGTLKNQPPAWEPARQALEERRNRLLESRQDIAGKIGGIDRQLRGMDLARSMVDAEIATASDNIRATEAQQRILAGGIAQTDVEIGKADARLRDVGAQMKAPESQAARRRLDQLNAERARQSVFGDDEPMRTDLGPERRGWFWGGKPKEADRDRVLADRIGKSGRGGRGSGNTLSWRERRQARREVDAFGRSDELEARIAELRRDARRERRRRRLLR